MSEPANERRLILSYARPEAYVTMARVILSNLGYAILSETEWRDTPTYASRQPELRIVDERQLADLPNDPALAAVPMIVLTGRSGLNSQDPAVIGAVLRPAGVHELYRLVQQAIEDHPRSTPRIPTNLPARLRQGDEEWKGSVLSLSENGCLLRTTAPLRLGSELEIAFELPQIGTVETRAESAYQLLPDLGLVFQATKASSREAILSFVESNLA